MRGGKRRANRCGNYTVARAACFAPENVAHIARIAAGTTQWHAQRASRRRMRGGIYRAWRCGNSIAVDAAWFTSADARGWMERKRDGRIWTNKSTKQHWLCPLKKIPKNLETRVLIGLLSIDDEDRILVMLFLFVLFVCFVYFPPFFLQNMG